MTVRQLEGGMGFFKKLFGSTNETKKELFRPPPPPTADAIAQAESALSISFPKSFVSFLRESGAMELPLCAQFYWVGDDSLGVRHIVAANRQEREVAGSPLPAFLVAFYNDGMGNQVCFDTRNRSDDGEYAIVFWDHELDSEDNLRASGRLSEHAESAGIIASSFAQWFKSQHQKPVT